MSVANNNNDRVRCVRWPESVREREREQGELAKRARLSPLCGGLEKATFVGACRKTRKQRARERGVDRITLVSDTFLLPLYNLRLAETSLNKLRAGAAHNSQLVRVHRTASNTYLAIGSAWN